MSNKGSRYREFELSRVKLVRMQPGGESEKRFELSRFNCISMKTDCAWRFPSYAKVLLKKMASFGSVQPEEDV